MIRRLPVSSCEQAAVSDAALREVCALYGELDRRLARLGVRCRACGTCCNFACHDYRLYVCRLERALVERERGPPHLTADGWCGFLRRGLCAAHTVRPLGCRTFFCDAAHKSREQDLYHAVQQRLRAVAEAYGVPWDYAPFFPASVEEEGAAGG